MSSLTIRLALAASLGLTAAMLVPSHVVLAQSPAPPGAEGEAPGALARDAIEKMMRALEIVIQNLPQYAMPEMNERGDIIIRRVNPRAENPRPSSPSGSSNETRT